MKRKKPEGKEWDEFVTQWHEATHEGKLWLADKYEVHFDTTKHWISDAGEGSSSAPSMRMTAQELIGSRPQVQLDFVSFDIETSNLRADFSIILSAVIKPFGKDPIVFRADEYKSWNKDRSNDADLVTDISDELRKHAIVITHYGQKFDIPFLRAKMVKHQLEPLPPMFGIDSWRIAKNNFAVSSRRLANLVSFFDIGEKGGVDGPLWMRAAYDADSDALDAIVEHNIIDCVELEALACVSFPFLKSIPKL